MPCECRTTNRDFALIVEDLDAQKQLKGAADQFGWEVHDELDAVRVQLGESHHWDSVSEFANFLKTVTDPETFESLRGDFVDSEPIRSQMKVLLHAPSIETYLTPDHSELYAIIEENRLTTAYQPVFSLPDMEVWGHECLLRATSQQGDPVSPGKLFGWATTERLHFMLDREARATHLQNAERDRAFEVGNVLINFLPTAIYVPEFCLQTTHEVADRLEINKNNVFFEVVETEQVEDRQQLVDILAEYRRAGFRVGLDDIGSGYSGLSMIGDLAPDLLKIDMDIVQSAPDSDSHRRVIESLVEIAESQPQNVLAEGVESRRQLQLVEDLGVDLVQGYFTGKPAPQPRGLS